MSSIQLNCDKNFIYVIIYWILEIIFRLLMYLKAEYFIMSDDIVKNEYMFVIFLNIADLLSGFLYLYLKQSTKSNKKEEQKLIRTETKKSLNQLIYNQYDRILRGPFIKKFIIIAILDYLSRSFFWIAYAISGAKKEEISLLLERDMVISIDVFMRYIFSIFILKIEVYRHLIVSIIGTVIGFVTLVVTDFLSIEFTVNTIKLNKTSYYVGILILRGISFPFEDTLVTQVFKAYHIFPELFQKIRGILEMIIIIVITPILFFSFGLELDFHFGAEQIITMIFYTIALFVKAYFLLKIIFHFSSQSVSFLIISESFGGAITEIIEIIQDKDKNIVDLVLIILEILGIIIIFIGSLVYNEIIIINKWGLNKNVKRDIIIRGEMELETIQKKNSFQDDEIHENDEKKIEITENYEIEIAFVENDNKDIDLDKDNQKENDDAKYDNKKDNLIDTDIS